ncbi:MAG: helix-turn-helix domain-containing protein [Promethearchaeota archaeon]
MRIIKLQIQNRFLKILGLMDILKNFEKIEILNIFQYDRKNFFSIQKITFKPGFLSNNDDQHNKEDFIINYLKKHLNAVEIDLIDKVDEDSIICMMHQRRVKGFWTLIIPKGPWAIIAPITIDKNESIVSIITTEKFFMGKLRNALRPYGRYIKVLANTRMLEFQSTNNIQPFPNFTKRQQQIAKFAVKNGYYNLPKKINIEDIAKKFNLSASTVGEHLRKVESIAMQYFFGK